jgi:predicted nucleotidyltransferase
MDNNLIIDQLVSILANTPIVELAYLFGSQVRGTTGPISDIDLGVLFADKVNTLSASSKLAYELQKALQSQQIDIVALRDVPIELAYAIIA